MASHWYGISEEEKQRIAENALQLTKSGRIPLTSEIEASALHEDSHHGPGAVSEKNDEKHDESKIESTV